jgi:hypothetical protein
VKKRTSRGGKREGAGRPPVDPAKKRHTRPVALNDTAWERICARAAATGRTTNDVIQRWAEQLPIL